MKYVLKYKKEILFMCLIIGVFCLRLLKLELDLPPWGVANYQPMDEGQYATMALNKYNYGSMRLDINLQERSFMTGAHFRNNIVGNVLVYIGMLLFGDNYYGLRSSSVLVGFINLILLGVVLHNLRNTNGKENHKKRDGYLIIGILALFTFDFVYNIACRTVETTIYRMTCLQLMLYVLTFPTKNEIYRNSLRFILAGFLAVFSVFAIYITNIFMVLAVFGIVVFYGMQHGKKSFWEAFSGFVAGAGMAYVICDLYYNIVWGTSCIVNTMQIISDFSGASGYTGGNSVIAFLIILLNFFSANPNLYNIGIAFVFLLSIPLIIRLIIKGKDENVFILFITYCMFLLQTFINEDYIVRKYVLVFPIVIYLIYIVAISVSKKEMEGYLKKVPIWSLIYSIVCLCICIGIIIYRLFFISNGTHLDFSSIDKIIVLSQVFFIIIVENLMLWLIFRKKVNISFVTKLITGAIVIGCLVPNIYFNLKYVILNESYTEKELMQELGEYANENWVYGIYSISFTLYNDIKPIVNFYDNMGNQIVVNGDSWYLDYSDYMFPSEVTNREISKWHEYAIFERDFSTFAQKRSVSLYKIEPKNEKE